MKRLNKRQKSFVQYYCDIGSETYGNGTKSALAAGYSRTDPATTAHLLLKKIEISREIDRLSQEIIESTRLSREQKRSIAWTNYTNAVIARAKEFWWTEVCKLDGDYINKQEIKSDQTIQINQKEQDIIKTLYTQSINRIKDTDTALDTAIETEIVSKS